MAIGGKQKVQLSRKEFTTGLFLYRVETNDESSTAATHRRRRRRSTADGVTPGETIEEDGVITVVKVRESRPVREVRERPRKESRSPVRRSRENRSEYREPYRKRGTIITVPADSWIRAAR